jgi:hypothetical protein
MTAAPLPTETHLPLVLYPLRVLTLTGTYITAPNFQLEERPRFKPTLALANNQNQHEPEAARPPCDTLAYRLAAGVCPAHEPAWPTFDESAAVHWQRVAADPGTGRELGVVEEGVCPCCRRG